MQLFKRDLFQGAEVIFITFRLLQLVSYRGQNLVLWKGEKEMGQTEKYESHQTEEYKSGLLDWYTDEKCILLFRMEVTETNRSSAEVKEATVIASASAMFFREADTLEKFGERLARALSSNDWTRENPDKAPVVVDVICKEVFGAGRFYNFAHF